MSGIWVVLEERDGRVGQVGESAQTIDSSAYFVVERRNDHRLAPAI